MVKVMYKMAAKDTRPLYVQGLRMLPYGIGPAVNTATLPKGTSTKKWAGIDLLMGTAIGSAVNTSLTAGKNLLKRQPLLSGFTKKVPIRGAIEGAAFGTLGSLVGSFIREKVRKR